MKNIAAAMIVFASFSAMANWTETVTCTVLRGNVDTGESSTQLATGNMRMSGPHNAEAGTVTLKSGLAPSYSIVVEKISSGRTDETSLTTKLGTKVVAMSSVDDQQSPVVENKFMTLNGDYQITVTCTSTPAL